MTHKPKKAFVLAAGKGTRLRPYTDTIPKPMVEIAGKSIIKRTLEKLNTDGINDVVVNLYHHADILEEHLSDIRMPKIFFSKEEELLETGGGIKKAIGHFGRDPFYIINGDALWLDGPQSAFSRMANAWDDDAMDILLFLLPKSQAGLTEFVGDYDLHADGQVVRSPQKRGDHMFAGVRIAKPSIFDHAPEGAFSFLRLMDEAQEKGRLFGIAHDSSWYHISTPEDLMAVNADFQKRGL